MTEARVSDFRKSRNTYQTRASQSGAPVPTDKELTSYMISLDVLGMNEEADIETIR